MCNPTKFVTDLQAVDIDRISTEAVLKCSQITASQSFTVEAIKVKSLAAACLANWAINVVKYHDIQSKRKGIEIFSARQMHLGKEDAVDNAEVRILKVSSGEVVKDKTQDVHLGIDKRDVVELKCLAKPPQAVMKLTVCVNILLSHGPKEEGWASAKRMLADTSFLSKLQNFKTEDVSHEQLQEVQSILDSDDVFLDDNLKKVSKASYGLLVWVRSVLSEKAATGIAAAPRFW